ncbi:MAG: class I SAM-dependent methyltransferase [Candidatus Omnitrophica bacterium]|nr:class I SAM-dependent methyltransferase [Candidatus Omnitrophota bacterium]
MNPENEVKTCPVCDGAQIGTPFTSLPSFLECRNCGLLFQVRHKDDSSLNRAYEDEEEDASARRIQAEEEERVRYYHDLFERIAEGHPQPGRVLEIGCGTGGLLQRFQKAGWQCEGIEPSPRLRRIAEESFGGSVPIHSERIESIEMDLTSIPYDLIVGIDVIEHLPDPVLLPKKCFEWLKAEGTLFLQTPNAGSIRRYLQRESWEQLAPDEHLFIHTAQSLKRLLESTGFREVEVIPFSGSTTDSPARSVAMKSIGTLLRWMGMNNGLWASARKGKE